MSLNGWFQIPSQNLYSIYKNGTLETGNKCLTFNTVNVINWSTSITDLQAREECQERVHPAPHAHCGVVHVHIEEQGRLTDVLHNGTVVLFLRNATKSNEQLL